MSEYYVEVGEQFEYQTITDGITDIISNNLTNYDRGIITIQSGTYEEDLDIDSPSGVISFVTYQGDVYVSGDINVTNSGTLRFNSITGHDVISSSGAGLYTDNCSFDNVIASGSSYIIMKYPVFSSGVSIYNSNNIHISNFDTSGSGSYVYLEDSYDFKLTSGNISNNDGSEVLSIINSSSGYVGNVQGYNYDTSPVVVTDSSGILFNHNTIVNLSGDEVMSFTNSSGNINYSIIAASGVAGSVDPISNTTSTIIASGSFLVDYYSLSNSGYGTAISGVYHTNNPLLVDPGSGNLKLLPESPCNSAAEYINEVRDYGENVTQVDLTEEAIKFYKHETTIKSEQPDNIYIGAGNKYVYFKSDEDLDDDMDVVINTQYESTATVTTIQSLSADFDSSHPYSKDYKLIPRLNYGTNEVDYYAYPYTIIPTNSVAMANSNIQKITVSGFSQNKGLSRDHSIESDGTPYFWIGETYNNMVNKYSSVDNTIIDKYLLLSENNVSGVYNQVKLDDISYISKGVNNTYIQSKKVWENDKFYTKKIYLDNDNSFFNLINTEIDKTKEYQSLVEFKDWVYVAVKNKINETAMTTDLYIYNKYDRFMFEKPVSILSRIDGLIYNEVNDMTMDDEGCLYIATASGIVNKYVQRYDYAYINNDYDDTIKTNITFREKYTEVNV